MKHIKLVVALGNPGPEYELTRHNIGWLALDNLSFESSLIWKNKFKGVYGDCNLDGEKRYFLKPHTFMNLSGDSVQALMAFFKIEPEEMLVVQDELDLPFGTIAVKIGGGLAGHKGLKSIAQRLGTNEFNRLRMGIGRPTHGNESAWVLSAFNSEDEISLGPYLEGTAKVIEECLEKGIQASAKNYKKKSLITIPS